MLPRFTCSSLSVGLLMIFGLNSNTDLYPISVFGGAILNYHFFYSNFAMVSALFYFCQYFQNSFLTWLFLLCLFINIMQQLKKAKSQQLIDRLFNNNTRQNYYEHHNMPKRASGKNFYKTTTNSPRRSQLSKSNSKEKKVTIGRQLYPQIPKKIQDPGPGTYDWTFSEPKSFKFTIHSNKNRKIFPIKSRQQRIGPGFYKYERATQTNLLSNYKKSFMTKINKSPQKQQRLVYPTPMPETPGPDHYNNNTNLHRVSNHHEPNSHKISITARSSIIRADKLPGPGYYRWDQYFDHNKKEKRRPAIQYKFVYGHPS